MNAPLIGGQTWHEMMPQPNHDDLARQLFVQSLQKLTLTELLPSEKHLYESRVKPQLVAEIGEKPLTGRIVRKAMDRQSYVQMTSLIRRASKDMEFETITRMLEPELPALVAKARAWRDRDDKLGSLTLDPDLEIPAYNREVHIHGQPGGYHTDFVEDDVLAGAIFERAFFLGQWGGRGPLCDDMGISLANWIKANLPDLEISNLLDMGCTNGQSTMPLVDAFPDARIDAIDLGAPCLRYGHARAEALGKAIHFSQQNAESTNFADGSFDVVVSMILLHETSASALRNIFRESYRLLRPGGYMLHVDSGHPKNFPPGDPFRRSVAMWQERYGYEPFNSRVSEMDWHAAAVAAGFAADHMYDSPIVSTVANAPTQRYLFAAQR